MDSNLPLVVTILLQAAIILLCLLFIYRLFQLYRIYVSKTHLESAFDSIDDPLAIVSNDYHIQRVNRAYAALVGDSFTELIGKHCYTVLRGRPTPCEDCRLAKVLSTGMKQYVSQSPHPKLPDTRTLSFTFYPFLEKNGKRLSVVEHVRDITELEELRRGLEERNRILEETGQNLRRAQRDIRDELDLARQVQQGTLPTKPPDHDALRINQAYQPIESVGGDVYDYVRLPGNRLGLFVGDASGHGLSSAYVSTIAKMLLNHHSSEDLPVEELLDRMNRDLLENINTSHYLTCWWGIFDPHDNSLTYARAGHPTPILIHKNGEAITLDGSGTFAGIIDTPQYERRKVFLHKGDRCYLFTDGIYEVIDKMSDGTSMLGYQRFYDIVTTTNRLAFDELIPAIKGRLGDYLYEDDYTLITMEVTSEGLREMPDTLPGFALTDVISLLTLRSMEEAEGWLPVISRTMAKCGFPDTLTEQTCRAITELVSNAFTHGNTNDRPKNVTLAYSIEQTGVKVAVTGEQPQSDRTRIERSPRRAPLPFIEEFADSFGHTDKGDVVYFTKTTV
jgi:sigma-B regulation protein RsbU (phosphoserine phosphatase)